MCVLIYIHIESDANARQCMFIEGGWKQKSCVSEIDQYAGIHYPKQPQGLYNWTQDPYVLSLSQSNNLSN